MFGLSEAAEAHRALEARRTSGKLLLILDTKAGCLAERPLPNSPLRP